jgi:hypothetical protein
MIYKGKCPPQAKFFWHFEVVKIGFTRGNARRRRKFFGTFRLPQAKKIAFGYQLRYFSPEKLIGTNSVNFKKLIGTRVNWYRINSEILNWSP